MLDSSFFVKRPRINGVRKVFIRGGERLEL